MDNISLALRDLIELADHLRQERLFVLSEQSRLHELNEKVVCASSKLAQLAWVSAQHRLNLNRLVLSRPDCSPAACCQRADSLDSTEFIDAYKVLGYQDAAMFGQFLERVRNSPELVASCLAAGDRLMPAESTAGVIQSMVAGLYGSCLLPSDRALVLRLLKALSQLQLVTSDDPRRLLRHGSCAFARLYSVFHEGLFSAKLFLTAALHGPITHVLTDDKKFLDIDPDKLAVRFPPEERLKKFGVEGTAEYDANVRRYRAWTVQSLVQLTQRFIRSLRDNQHCFPSSICWLIRHIASTATVPPKEVFVMCCDLVLTYFICLAVVNPEPWGITDVGAISYVARSNLIQVAQILQMLALSKHEPIDPRLQDLYSQFDKDCVSSIVESMLEGGAEGSEPAPPDNSKLNGLSRNAALFTEAELFALVGFLQSVAGNSTDVDVDKKALMNLLSLLPRNPSPTPTPTHHTTNGQAKKSQASAKGSSYKSDALDEGLGGEEEVNKPVLVIPFDTNANPSVGFLSEQKVLEMQRKGILVDDLVRVGIEGGGVVVAATGGAANGLDHEPEVVSVGGGGSTGAVPEADNSSDVLELAVSEAASNHSVTSSISDTAEDHNDNLSDMISANVSGRDTPSSQMTEGDEGGGGGGGGGGGRVGGGAVSQAGGGGNKQQCRFDIDEKFGKFQIKKLMEGAADETISMVSDTWSTDVLASDSEIIEAVPPMQQSLPNTPQLLDVSETASDAWSTCVMASDSERLTEVDTDDTASVARSDDTARSEVGDGGEDGGGGGAAGSAGGFGCRSIREENERLSVPLSPTKAEAGGGGGGGVGVAGVSGLRGGSFRRRTLDCASVPSRSAGGSLSLSEERERAPDLKSSLAPSSSSLNTPKLSQQTSSQEVSMEESESGGVASGGGIVCLSTASLASTSSSSSSEPRLKATQELSLPGTPLVLNGSVVMVDSASGATSSKPMPSTSTGAIPKSISFDKTAERGDKESLDEDGKSRRSFFRFKLPFKKGKGRSSSFRTDDLVDCEEPPRPSSSSRIDTSDDILAKYRRKVVVTSSNGVAKQPGEEATVASKGGAEEEEEEEDERLVIDPANVEASFAFRDAKKKLRLVLSTAEVVGQHEGGGGGAPGAGTGGGEGQLVSFLRLQLAEAMNLQDRPLIAHLHETLRCVRLFDSVGCVKLFASLRDDYKQRTPYVSYLVHCRQSLLSTLVHLERLTERVRCERAVCQRFLMAVCVRLFLERREGAVAAFAGEFQQLSLADEKNDLLDAFLQRLAREMERDPLWQAASDAQLEMARTAIERAVVSRVYIYAMFPNGDGDVSRDQVLHEHMKKLSNVITPSHKDLRIPKVFCYECPWPSAQAELAAMSAHKTAGDKVACVLRCCQTILNLLSLAAADQLSTVPAADDLVPVLVYVLIKANPPSLLSTVAYVNSFYESRLEGEDRYWWVQFCSAIEFIKTMDYVLSD